MRSRSTTALSAIATAVPPGRMSNHRTSVLISEGLTRSRRESALVAGAAQLTGIQGRHSVLFVDGSDPDNAECPFYFERLRRGLPAPSTADRMALYARESPRLACQVARRVLEDAAVPARDVTHLVTVSCTGFFSPGLDCALIQDLGLCPDVARAHLGFMGCHGALNACGVARGFAGSHPDAVVLVTCVELCSLHFQFALDRNSLVPSLLFSDGAAALVIRPGGSDIPAPLHLSDTASELFPDSAGAMTWRITDTGFRMTLDKSVPDRIAGGLAARVEAFLGRHGLRIADVAAWAIHPGGPRILDAALESLHLDPDHGQASRHILAQYGNMSSPTVLFILKELLSGGARGPIVALAFGPGLVAEMALFHSNP